MRFAFFYHSLISDWNHGNAHFLRGVVAELLDRGHQVRVFEPRDGWSITNLVEAHGPEAIEQFHRAFPGLETTRYRLETLDLDRALDGVDVVLVHEWNPPELVDRLGARRAAGAGFRLFFHDTHHRAVSDRELIAAFDLDAYDGVLAFGESLRQRYLREGWEHQVWTWHEAADTRVFHPRPDIETRRDLVWIGNWGDGERDAELREYFLEPAEDLDLETTVFGVRYPDHLLKEFRDHGIAFEGWVPNYRVPEVFGRHRATLHIPRRPYVDTLPGVPTIRVFEALACGIPLVCAPWRDVEDLFRPGTDYLVAEDGDEMAAHLRALHHDDAMADELAARGLETIRERHTCAHRVDQLLGICRDLQVPAEDVSARSPTPSTPATEEQR
ncbi:MAG: glycosyltransferase [Bradymonadaceae bacterium]